MAHKADKRRRAWRRALRRAVSPHGMGDVQERFVAKVTLDLVDTGVIRYVCDIKKELGSVTGLVAGYLR